MGKLFPPTLVLFPLPYSNLAPPTPPVARKGQLNMPDNLQPVQRGHNSLHSIPSVKTSSRLATFHGTCTPGQHMTLADSMAST